MENIHIINLKNQDFLNSIKEDKIKRIIKLNLTFP